MEFLANTLTNRLLHAPTHALRQAAELADYGGGGSGYARLLIGRSRPALSLQGRYNRAAV